MRVITHCPACQTQFFATEEQLNKHDGKVRCGHCRHVFDARAQMLDVAQDDNPQLKTPSAAPDIAAHEYSALAKPAKAKSKKTKTDTTTETKLSQPAYVDGISGKSKLKQKLPKSRIKLCLWTLACLLAIVAALLQSLYFMRNEIALYYPQLKPILIQSCEVLRCKIELPKQIEFIVIDDSDMQEDPERVGLIYFGSTLINTGGHAVAFPNLELTLTDTEDNPVVRRLFKPTEYLPTAMNIDDGLMAGTEIKIKLPISTSETAVSGYRVFVTY